MADLSAFSHQSFEARRWIDEMLREKSDEETLDSFLATLVMKLHVVSQEYTDQLEGGPVPFFLVRATLFTSSCV
jgi:hypothetical protein